MPKLPIQSDTIVKGLSCFSDLQRSINTLFTVFQFSYFMILKSQASTAL